MCEEQVYIFPAVDEFATLAYSNFSTAFPPKETIVKDTEVLTTGLDYFRKYFDCRKEWDFRDSWKYLMSEKELGIRSYWINTFKEYCIQNLQVGEEVLEEVCSALLNECSNVIYVSLLFAVMQQGEILLGKGHPYLPDYGDFNLVVGVNNQNGAYRIMDMVGYEITKYIRLGREKASGYLLVRKNDNTNFV